MPNALDERNPQVTEDRVNSRPMLTEPPLKNTRRLVAAGRTQDALAIISREIDAFPDWAEPWVVMAQALSQQCHFSEALRAADEALVRDPWHLQAHQLKTGLLLQLDYHESALEAARRLVALDAERAESHMFLSFACSAMGMEIDAIQEARECRRLASWRGYYDQALCVSNLACKRWEKAEQHAVAAMKIEGASATLMHDLGRALEGQTRYEAAQQAFLMAVRIDQRFQPALNAFNRRQLVPGFIRRHLPLV